MNLVELQRENEALKLANEALKLKVLKSFDVMCENEDLKLQNEDLMLTLFWKEHNDRKLRKAMSLANQAEGGPECSCLTCVVSGRHDSRFGEVDREKSCTFKPWFEQVLQEHGMSVGHDVDVPKVYGCVCQSHNDVFDDGQHFTNFARCDWKCWTYGSKLWKATSVGDVELAKLENLFWTLRTLDLKEE